MRKFFFIALSSLIASIATVSAQGGIYYGPKVGLNLSSLTHTSNATTRIRGSIGAFAGYQVSDLISLQAETHYSWQGSKIDGNNFSLNYLKIPVLGKISIIENLSGEAGVSFNILVSARENGKSYKGMNSFDMSIPIGVSYRFLNNFEAGLRYDLSLTNSGYPTSSNSKNSNCFISIAYRF